MKRITKEKSNLTEKNGEINIYLLLKFSHMPPDLTVLSMKIFIGIYINNPSMIILLICVTKNIRRKNIHR
jgi:hypothetical protein